MNVIIDQYHSRYPK